MPRRREVPHDPHGLRGHDEDGVSSTSAPYWDTHQYDRPMNPIDALMRCAPGDEPEPSQLETLSLREAIADALDEVLTPDELWLFNAVVVERRSLRQLERLTCIPKTTLARKRDTALAKLRDHLGDVEIVQRHLRSLNTHHTTQEADT